jgi:hypothetical protein
MKKKICNLECRKCGEQLYTTDLHIFGVCMKCEEISAQKANECCFDALAFGDKLEMGFAMMAEMPYNR